MSWYVTISYMFATIHVGQVCHKTCAHTGKAENFKLQTLIIMYTIHSKDASLYSNA